VLALGVLGWGGGAAEAQYAAAGEVSPPISRLTMKGEHFEALEVYYRKDPSSRSIADTLSAARSAWQLGLVRDSRNLWDLALSQEHLGTVSRARALLARSVLELQEREYGSAIQFAQRGLTLLEASDLRAQFHLVLAESFLGQKVLSEARSFYQKAETEGSEETALQARFLRGEVELRLGLVDEARTSFTKIPMSSGFATRALGHLIELDSRRRDHSAVLTWVEQLRGTLKPEQVSSKLNYQHIVALLGTQQATKANHVLKQMKTTHSESDEWYQLADAAVEKALLESHLESSTKRAILRGANE